MGNSYAGSNSQPTLSLSNILGRWLSLTSTITASTASLPPMRTSAVSWSGTTSTCKCFVRISSRKNGLSFACYQVTLLRGGGRCCSFELPVNRVEDTEHVVIPVQLREKYKQSGYNHTSTPLFGQPFLIAVPRTLSEDKLYNMLLLRLWYVSPRPPVPSILSFCSFLSQHVSFSLVFFNLLSQGTSFLMKFYIFTK